MHNQFTQLMKSTISCSVCGNEAELTAVEYSNSRDVFIIITFKCPVCGYRRNDVIPIVNENSNKCIEINVEHPEDLNTLIHLPQDTTIIISELSLEIEIKEFSAGSYVTLDNILIEVVEKLKSICSDLDNNSKNQCNHIIEVIENIMKGNIEPITIKLISDYDGVKIVKTYRENYKKC